MFLSCQVRYVKYSEDDEVWYLDSVTGETVWEIPPDAKWREAGEEDFEYVEEGEEGGEEEEVEE